MTGQEKAPGAGSAGQIAESEAAVVLRLAGLTPEPARLAAFAERLGQFRTDLRRLDRYQELATEPTVLEIPGE